MTNRPIISQRDDGARAVGRTQDAVVPRLRRPRQPSRLAQAAVVPGDYSERRFIILTPELNSSIHRMIDACSAMHNCRPRVQASR